MPIFSEIHLKPELLEAYGLPDIGYPVQLDALDAILGKNGEMPFAEMLFGLQERSREGTADWKRLELAMDRLAQLIAPPDTRDIITAAGDTWWLELGPVDLNNAKLVTIQRGGLLIAALTNRGDGRLRVAVFRPLDAKSAIYLIGLSLLPHPEYGVSMRENNWEYAIDQTPGLGNAFADERGEAYLCYWEKGLGIKPDGTLYPEWRAMTNLVPKSAALAAVELGVYYTLSDEYQEKSNGDLEIDSEPAQAAAYPQWTGKRQQQRTIRGRYLGCLLGGAIGDALGAPVEFMNRAEIIAHFGPQGITQYAPAYGGLGTITDDTQMTLFTAEGLLRAVARRACSDYTPLMEMVAESYLRWLFTQGIPPSVRIPVDSWLTAQKSLHARRAPGDTCLAALRDLPMPPKPSQNNSKGCGGVMRMAPVGLIGRSLKWDARRVFDSGCLIALLTHGHPSGVFPAGVLAVLILALLDGASLREGLVAAKALLGEKENYGETLRAIESAEELAAGSLPPREAIARLGQGWVGEEALAISIYSALVARSFEHGLILAVNHDGDSDSTGSITGNLLGALYGVKALPAAWLGPLELRGVIEEVAEDLYDCRDWDDKIDRPDKKFTGRPWLKYFTRGRDLPG